MSGLQSGKKKRLIFIRHGQTHENVEDILHQHTEDEAGINEKGKAQIERLVPLLKKNNVRVIFSSPEKRAIESAELVAAKMGLPDPIVLPSLTERQWGMWQGKPWDEIQRKLDAMSLHERYTFVPPKGESWKQMEERLTHALQTICSFDAESIAIVTHAGSLRGLMPILKNAPKQTSFLYDFHNASATIFDYRDGKFEEIIVGDVKHLGDE